MKMLSVIAVLAMLFSTGVLAGEHTINAVGRTGFAYHDHDSASVPNSSSFNMDYLRTTFAGVISPSVKYFVTFDLLGTATTDSVDGTSALVDEAFISKTFAATSTSFIFGKKAVLVGGREYDYLNYDRYSLSGFNNALPANQVGLTISQDLAGNTFMAQYFNGNKENGHSGTNAQSKFGYAVGWYGNILGGLIKPIVAYTVVPMAATGSRVNKGDDQIIAGGVQVTTPHSIQFEIDYDYLNSKDARANKADLKTTSIVGLIRYTGEKCSPFVKYISDTTKLDSTKTGTKMAYDVGVEFKESAEDMIRYHVVYSGSTVKTGINTTEVKTSPKSILVGLKFDAAVLK